MIVLDASVLIAYLDGADAHHRAAEELLVEAADDALGASTLTLAEVLVGPARASRLDEARRVLEQLEVEALSLVEGSAERLARLRVETGCRLPDCCVLLAAQDVAGAIATFDEQLRAAARHLGRPVQGG